MDEKMNLNGMGLASNVSSADNDLNTSLEQNNNIEPTNAEVVPEGSVEQQERTTENKGNNEIEQADNQIGFEDMDMIKELREAEEASRRGNESIFTSMDFGALKKYLDDDDVTDISYSNGGQLWLKTLSKGVYRVEEDSINDALIEKIAFQCSNIMGKTFNMAHPFLDSESAELRMNFIHDSIARNGIAVVFRKTPAKIRLEKEKLMQENYVSLSVHDFLIKAVQGHCNIIMCGETGSGKTEFLKYLASHTFENEKIVTIEDTLELHLDKIYPHRDIVAMKTNNIASYSDVLVTCMRQNPIWILLSEVRSAEAVTAVRNSISSGHFILSTIHADKASNIPYRLYSLLESNIDVEQFLNTIYRYIQLGVFLRGRFDPKQGRYVREIGEVTEFYVDDNNECISNTIYQKTIKDDVTYKPISEHLLDYLEGQGIDMTDIRNSNGDLQKAQSYSDENSNLGTDNPVADENQTEEVKTIEEKVVPITEEENINPISDNSSDLPPVIADENETPITEEKVVPITEEENINPISDNSSDLPPVIADENVTPITEEKVVPITEEENITPISDNSSDLPPVIADGNKTPITEEKVVPITEEENINPISDNSSDLPPVIADENATPITEEKVVPITEEFIPNEVVQPINQQPVEVQPFTEVAVEPIVSQISSEVTPITQNDVVNVVNSAINQQPVQSFPTENNIPTFTSDVMNNNTSSNTPNKPISASDIPIPTSF